MNTQPEIISKQAEEYLEAIFRLEQKMGYARTMDLSKCLNVVPGSITNTIENLERKGFVVHKPYKGVKLSDNGRKIASIILRRHRLAERFLTDILHLDWSKVHDPACKLEHAFSPEIITPLEKALGYPKKCPHGNPIPTDCGGIVEEETVPLTELDTKTSGVVMKIIEEEVEILQKLTKLKLTPGQRVKIEKVVPKGSLTICIDEQSWTIERDLASVIHVKKI